jgi:segregation and condensation protein B
MTDASLSENPLSLPALIESLLFIAPGTVSPSQLAAVLEVPISEIEVGLNELDAQYSDLRSDRGLRLQRHRGRVQLTTPPQAAELIERFLGLETSGRLSHAALETLAIVLYKQPVTRPQIDGIRGVNSDYVLRSLLRKGLIQEIGRAETPGRPILYSSTPELMQYFGLNSIDEMPPLDIQEESGTELSDQPDLDENINV